MAKGFNQVIIMGNLTRDPELRTIPSGQSVCSFSIAVNRSWTNSDGETQDAVDYFDVVAWAKLGELVNQYMSKGRRCLVVGRLQNQTWEAQDGTKRKRTEIVANDVTFLDGGSGTTDSSGQSSSQSTSDSAASKSKKNDKDEDVVVEDIDESKPVDLSDIPF